MMATRKGWHDGIALVRAGAHMAVSGEPDVSRPKRRHSRRRVSTRFWDLRGGSALEQASMHCGPGRPSRFPNGVEPAPRKRKGSRSQPMTRRRPERVRETRARLEAARHEVPIAAVYPLAERHGEHERLVRGMCWGRSSQDVP